MNPLITKLEMIAVLLPEDRQTLTELGRATQVVNKGRDIVREGEKPTHVYVLLNGWAARYTVLRDGSRQIMAFLLPGDVCNGKITILGKMDHSVVALSPVTVAAIERDAFIAGTQNRPNLAEAFWRITLVEEAILRAWIANLGRRGAYARVAHLICELHARLATLGLFRQESIAFPLTLQHLSDALGLTPVHTSRVFRQLRNEGIIRLENRILTLLDVKRLQAIAGFNPTYLHSEAA